MDGGSKNVSSVCEMDVSKLRSRARQRSFDERSLSECCRKSGSHECGGSGSASASGVNSPAASSACSSMEPHPMVADAWESLRRSLVYFRGQPVGTIAAYDHASEEVLNYDQVN